jgi:beta-phosphoglucomutase-like phosphatase (HAD superfamily)
MMGMSSKEWSRYMHDVIGLSEPPDEIVREVLARMLDRYEEHLPLVDGAVESSNRELIDKALEVSGLAPSFRATVSSEEVARGKPAPDVYLEAARRLGVKPRACAAIEDSASGILSADAAEMSVVAIPNRAFPPPEEVLRLADVVLDSIKELEPATLDARRDSSRRAP